MLSTKPFKHMEVPKAIFDAWERVQDEWLNLSVETCRNLISSMSDRIQAVLGAKVGNTSY